jgi:hypothetical protein
VLTIILVKSPKKGKRTKKQDTAGHEERPWKIAYVILCLALITLTAYQFVAIREDPTAGWDYYVFAGAIQSFAHGQNPYILANVNQYVGENTGGNLPFTYPPHTLYFFWLLDLFFIFHSIVIYYILLVVLLIISGYLLLRIDQKPHYLFLITLLVTGFMGTAWNFGTGNKDIFFLFLFAIIFMLLLKEKYWHSSIIMGLAAGISLITAPFVALYLAVRRPPLERLTYIFLSGGVVAALFVVSYCVNPTYLVSYIGTLERNSTSPMYDVGGFNTPTPFLMFWDLLKGVNLEGVLPVAIVSCGYIGLILYATWNYCGKNRENTLQIYSVVMLAIFMILPRIKPYDFILLVIPLYFLFKDYSYRIKSLVFVVISLPLYFWYCNFVVYTTGFPFLLGVYTQTYSLILIFIILILYNHLKPAASDEEKGGKKPGQRKDISRRTPASHESNH